MKLGLAITQEEIDFIGLWYSRHYSVSLSIPSLNRYLRHLRLHASLPDQRLPGQTETDAGNILKACAALGLDRYCLAAGFVPDERLLTWLGVRQKEGARLLAMTTGVCFAAAAGLAEHQLLATHWA
ncbi:TPA: hypothetical protein ACSPPR_005772 [Pseudomonas aeruginosa]